MILRRFYINLILRIVLIFANIFLLVFVMQGLFLKQLMFTFLVVLLLLIGQIILLFFYIKKSNDQIARFLQIISDSDYNLKFKEAKKGLPYKGLNDVLNKILDQYQEVKKEKEKQYFLTQHIVDTISAGILVINEKGIITFKNNQAKEILSVNDIVSLNKIKEVNPDFVKKLDSIGGQGSLIFELANQNEKIKLSIAVKTIRLFDQKQRVISLQDVSKEVDSGEIDAMNRLMRILTHEIMNSLTPINSLTETISMLMSINSGEPKPFEDFNIKNYNDIRESILAIKERGEGLDHFVNNFRRLARLPEELKIETIKVQDLVNSVCKLMHAELNMTDIRMEIAEDDLNLNVDVALIEQVLINLLTNSLEAVSKQSQPYIKLKSFIQNNNVIIQVIDNGSGIPANKIDDIFIPFYTTKDKGSGIGLSLSRQIMHLHKGSIHVQSVNKKHTTFTLKF